MKKMIRTAAFLIVCIIGISCNTQAQDGFTVKVKVNNPNNRTMLIGYADGEDFVMDTTYTMEKGFRVYKSNLKTIAMVNFVVRGPNAVIMMQNGGMIPGPVLSFVARNGATITIEGDAENIHMANITSDDKETKAYEEFRKKNKVWVDEIFKMDKQRYGKPFNGAEPPADINPERRKVLTELQGNWAREFVKKYASTYAAIEVFATYALEMSDDEQAKQFAQFPDTYKNVGLGKVIQEKINGSNQTAIGKAAINFSQQGLNGSQVDLGALNGKVVLIDFWGSWCVPCRASFPHLKELYAKYKSKGFEIVGIAKENGSKESQHKAWSEAVKKDQINWLNILNDEEKDNIVKKYGVVAFPTKILVDRNGIIQGRYTGDQEGDMEVKLNELLQTSGNAQAGATGKTMQVITSDKVPPGVVVGKAAPGEGVSWGRTTVPAKAQPAAKKDSAAAGKTEPSSGSGRTSPAAPSKKN